MWSTTVPKACGCASNGVMSLNTIPGCGKSGNILDQCLDILQLHLVTLFTESIRVRDNAALGIVTKSSIPTMSLSKNILAGAVGALNAGGKILQRTGCDAAGTGVGYPAKGCASAQRGYGTLGDWPVVEPLERLLVAYRHEAHLTTLGRITVRELLTSLLENLLYLEAERKRSPSVTEEIISAPTFIIGPAAHRNNAATRPDERGYRQPECRVRGRSCIRLGFRIRLKE